MSYAGARLDDMAIKGLKEHLARLKKLQSPQTVDLIEKALFAAGQLIENEAGLSITRGSVSGKNHVASKKGEPPNNDTGVLARSIETNKAGRLKVRVTANAPYSVALEKGSGRKAGVGATSFPTRKDGTAKFGPIRREFGDSKTAARPFMRPARDKKKDEAQALVAKAMNVALKRAKAN